MPSKPEDNVTRLSVHLKASWPAIRRARLAADNQFDVLNAHLGKYTTEDTTIVVFGSLARRELTAGSDLDWILLVDGSSSSEHLDVSLEIDSYLKRQKLTGPGPEGVFGGPVSSHDLIHYIGGEDDTNRNLTRRMLLLLESHPIGRPDAYRRVVNSVLQRYIAEDFGWMHGRNLMNVPRFLQNDFARYWRTLAVDFAYKRRQRAGRGWALRTAKLRLSRKLIYAAGLLMCYSCAVDAAVRNLKPQDPDSVHAIVVHLASFVERTPLDIFAGMFLQHAALRDTAINFFETYDRFLAVLNDKRYRSQLDGLGHEDIEKDKTYQEIRRLSQRFQAALNDIFFAPKKHKKYYELTQAYGVF